MSPGYIEVVNLERFQHYKDRSPPWIKLYASLLDNYEFACLQDASKAHLCLIWVLASRHDNRIPADPAWIAQRIGARNPVELQPLIDAGFMRLVQPASTTLAPRAESAPPERETENKEKTVRPALRAVVGNPLLGALEKAPALTPPPALPASPLAAPPVDPPSEPATWTADAAGIYKDRIGLVPVGRIGKALKPLVTEYGWPRVRKWWDAYTDLRPYQKPNGQFPQNPSEVGDKDVRFCSPEDFVKTYVKWQRLTETSAAS